ncbi:hypothetical protein H6P81_020756 [Aristolochia fimbriata]|uniref:Glycosyltransferase n=1 Tax=Aristolochia fimbriata TaxID=158543 RepID=A0AAV7DYJ6_ARIFI|nr:hypothetical protein H6P81_020756 [Aristolochia fimbriata]
MGKPHAVVVPFPAQGHVLPLTELSHRLVDNGFRVTMVCTEFDKARILAASKKEEHQGMEGISFASVPDGLETDDDRGDVGLLCKFVLEDLEPLLEDLFRRIHEREEDKISCVIADVCAPPASSVAKKMGLPTYGFCPASAANLALCFHIPKLIESGIIVGENGTILEEQIIQISPTIPEMSTRYFAWNCLPDPRASRLIYRLMIEVTRIPALVDRILCNCFRGLESPALDWIPKAVPIGPLLPPKRPVTKPVAHFWAEDPSCLTWLDQQQDRSVIYVSFGSFTLLNQAQFEELAAGLEQSGRPFLWVVRPNLMSGSAVAYPENFLDRVGERGKMVSWAPQQKVLAHRAVACFVSHCGWNSTMEGLSNGVPFLCWPYFSDQFLDMKYICEVWKTGLELKADENGIITREEIRRMVGALLCDEGIETRASKMKETAEEAVGGGGTSRKNFDDFIEEIKRRHV